jgi:ribonuclease-3
MSEGDLAKRKSALASGEALAATARQWNLGTYLHLGKSEQESGGEGKESILAGATEALVGAIYLDSDLRLEAARQLLERFHFSRLDEILEGEIFLNPKSQLLELTQHLKLGIPSYHLQDADAPVHRPVFRSQAVVNGQVVGEGQGRTKKAAETMAAKAALSRIHATLEIRTNPATAAEQAPSPKHPEELPA